MAHITAIVLTFNEEVNIGKCLDSIQTLCDEILIVDSGSTDATLDIAGRYHTRVFHHAFSNSAAQWDWALQNLPITYDWVIPVDSDHVFDGTLRQSLSRIAEAGDKGTVGYFSRHQYMFLGEPMRGFKQFGLRMFRKGQGSIDPGEYVDFKFVIAGPTAIAEGTVFEDNLKEASIDFWIDKHQSFSTRVAAQEVLRHLGQLNWQTKPRLTGNHDERIVWMKIRWNNLPLFLRPLLYFFYRYVIRLGVLDGVPGLIYHFMQALWYRMLIDVKILGIRQRMKAGLLSQDKLDCLATGQCSWADFVRQN
jgi:glycosyltransferase involved in cell wall biosynthesis